MILACILGVELRSVKWISIRPSLFVGSGGQMKDSDDVELLRYFSTERERIRIVVGIRVVVDP